MKNVDEAAGNVAVVKRMGTLVTPVVLMMIVFIAHFLRFQHLGLYEDDYYFVSTMWRWPELMGLLGEAFTTWPQGRPLGFSLPPLLSFLGFRLGGLPAIYVIGFLMLSLNTCLFYTLLRKVGSESVAVIGALAYCLFPADTAHVFLGSALGLQVAMALWLAGAHFYLSGQRPAAYVALTASLLTYETPYLVFAAIPLLGRHSGRALLREGFRNGVILAGIMLVVIAIRMRLGEERLGAIGGQDLPGIGLMIIKSLAIGPAVSMQQFVYAPIRALLYWDWRLTLLVAAPFAAVIWMLCRSTGQPGAAQDSGSGIGTGRLVIAGAAMLVLAYALSFTHYPPVEVFGRGTSVHLAATFGGSILLACLFSEALSVAQRLGLRSAATTLPAVYMSLLVGYGVLIQTDFVKAWQDQRSFWTSAIDLLPDITDGTVIFLVNKDLPETRFILSHSWSDPIILPQLFDFPAYWLNPPRLFVVPEDWYRGLAIVDLGSDSGLGKHLEWMVPEATWESHPEVFPNGNVIILAMEGGRLVRRQGTMTIGGVEFRLKPLPPGETLDFETGPLFDVLIGDGK